MSSGSEKLLKNNYRKRIETLLSKEAPDRLFTYEQIFCAVCTNVNGLRSFTEKQRQRICTQLLEDEFPDRIKNSIPSAKQQPPEPNDARKRTRRDQSATPTELTDGFSSKSHRSDYKEVSISWQCNKRAKSSELCTELSTVSTFFSSLQTCVSILALNNEDFAQGTRLIPQNRLLLGDRGSGRTSIGKALSAFLPPKVNYVEVPARKLLAMQKADIEIKLLFDVIEDASPCYVFLDDFDMFLPASSSNRDKPFKEDNSSVPNSRQQIRNHFVNSFSELMRKELPIFFLAIAEAVSKIDSSILDYFSKVPFCISKLSSSDRLSLLNHMIAQTGFNSDQCNLQTLQHITSGWTPKELRQLVQSALDCAILDHSDEIKKTSFTVEASSGLENIQPFNIERCETVASETNPISLSDDDEQSTVKAVAIDQEIPDIEMETRTNQEEADMEDRSVRISVVLNQQHFDKAFKELQPQQVKDGFMDIPTVTMQDVGGLKEQKDIIENCIIDSVLRIDELKGLSLDDPSGVLLWGPPGCGKTLLAQAIANACQARFIYLAGAQFLNKYVGESELQVRRTFEQARLNAPCLIFFDEFDAICPNRDSDGQNEVTKRVVNALLAEMDGVHNRRGVFVIAATNRPQLLDPAMLRSGRLEHLIYLPHPDEKARLDILKAICSKGKSWRYNDGLLELIALKTEGFSGADLKKLLKGICKTCYNLQRQDKADEEKITELYLDESVSLNHVLQSRASLTTDQVKMYEEHVKSEQVYYILLMGLVTACRLTWILNIAGAAAAAEISRRILPSHVKKLEEAIWLKYGQASIEADLLNLILGHEEFEHATSEVDPGKLAEQLANFSRYGIALYLKQRVFKQDDNSIDENDFAFHLNQSDREYPHFKQEFSNLQLGINPGSTKDDTPCDSQESCDKIASRMNACANLRGIANTAYSVFLAMTNVLTMVMSVLCACLFLGPVHFCVLKMFPYTCVFPYQIYATFINLSSSVWETVKTLSSLCSSMGDPVTLLAQS